jgi:hypothetical protein
MDNNANAIVNEENNIVVDEELEAQALKEPPYEQFRRF